MRKIRPGLVLSACVLGMLGIAATAGAAEPSTDPIGIVGHGTFIGPDGKHIKPTATFLREAQSYYLSRLEAEASPAVLDELRTVREKMARAQRKLGFDDVIARSFLIHWLITEVQPEDAVHLRAKNAAIRNQHLLQVESKSGPQLSTNGWGLSSDVLAFAEAGGFVTLSITGNSGQAYINECRAAQVPIPPTWLTGGWTFEGNMPNSELFLTNQTSTEVWSFETTTPNGICVALPRITGATIGLLGIICLNRTNGNTCFWDRSNTPVGIPVALNNFLGGTALGDVCSDCHAGENPYVVHPGTVIDLGARMKSDVWHNPIVPPGFPENPGPNQLLGLLPLASGEESCLGCHNKVITGRLPEVSTELSGYCNRVLNNAIVRTMPLGNPGDPAFQKHMDALTAFCSQRPPDGMNVPGRGADDDPKQVGAPIIIGPLYGCASAIEVTGVVLHADLEVYIDGVLDNTVSVVSPNQQVVPVTPLVAGQIVTAKQIVDGVTSAESEAEEVHDHNVDYPAGLPPAEIDPPLIHECGLVIAVRHLQGATVTVYVNGADPSTVVSSGKWTNVAPAIRPFNLGDVYTADYQMCNDPPSPLSQPETAVAPPSSMPTPAFDPPTVYAGQELVKVENLANGALTRVFVDGFGMVSDFSTAISWKEDIDVATAFGSPLSAGDILVTDSALCVGGRRTSTAPASPCTALPAPKIQQPFVGDTTVVVTQAVGGARILVVDQNGAELGDSAGSTISLNRALVPGDVLKVRQKIGPCYSAEAYQVTVMCTAPNQGC